MNKPWFLIFILVAGAITLLAIGGAGKGAQFIGAGFMLIIALALWLREG